MRLYAILLVCPFIIMSAASAQEWTAMTTPYGQTIGGETTPMTVASRDSNGTRIVINGRIIDAGEPTAAPRSFARKRQPSTSLSQQGTLGQTTLNSLAIGNSVEINNVSNSIITINQTNTGNQTATTAGF